MQAKKGFSDHLAYGYALLAEYEAFIEADGLAAARFYEKQTAAEEGKTVEPDMPNEDRLGKGDYAEMTKGRQILVDARKFSDQGDNARLLAEAQVNFDCWVERGEEDSRSARYCRERFYDALAGIDMGKEQEVFSVFFDVGKAVPDPASLISIQRAASAFLENDYWSLYLVGHTDPKGDKQSNMLLSMRRALAVRNALAQHGVDLQDIVIKAAGEETPPEEGADPADLRRVDIVIEQSFVDHTADKAALERLAPHYFGQNAPPI